MEELLQRLSNVELGAAFQALLDFLDTADAFFLVAVVAVLVFIGARMVSGQPALRTWGLRIALAVFLVYGGYSWFSHDADADSPHVGRLALRSGCAAGCALAAFWITVPVLAFLLARVRLALAVFLGYGAYALLVTNPNPSAHELGGIALRGGLAVVLAMAVAWILDPVWNYIRSNILPQRQPTAPMQTVVTSIVEPLPTPRRASKTMLAPHSIGYTDPEMMPTLDLLDQRRRDRARMQLEMEYLRAMPAAASWLPRKTFDDLMVRHLGDHLSADQVEENARQMLEVLQRHEERLDQRVEVHSLEDLACWLLEEQRRIQGLSLDSPIRQTQLVELHQRYLRLATRIVQNETAA